jgi:AraC family transcriptional regulator
VKLETRTYYEIAVLRAVERVAGSLDEALDLEALARAAVLLPFHFHRVFRGLVSETPLELHRRLRLERAAERLYGTSSSVTDIAFDAGYETHEAFTRAFRDRYGESPSAFRQRAADASRTCHGGPPVELAARCGLHVRKGRVDLAALTLTTTGGVTMEPVIEILSTRRLATVRHVGPYPRIARTACDSRKALQHRLFVRTALRVLHATSPPSARRIGPFFSPPRSLFSPLR